MRIALAGTGTLALKIMWAIEKSDHDLVAIVQNGRKVRGIMRWFLPTFFRLLNPNASVTGYAKRNGLPIVYIDKMSPEELRPLRAVNADLLVVSGFAVILKKDLLELPSIGCVNCHPSLLPLHRGPNPFSAVILAQRDQTGVTFHVMDEGIDTGDILGQYPIDLEDNETAGTVYQKTSILAGERIAEILDRVAEQGLKGTPQVASEATYDKKMSTEELFLDWRQPAEDLERRVRACLPFTIPRFRARGKNVLVTRVELDETENDMPPGTILKLTPGVTVATGKGALVLRIAYVLKPFPWVWPPRLFHPFKVGDRIE